MSHKVILFSGGRTSGYMLHLLKKRGALDQNTTVCFANTGKEMPQTLEFVKEVGSRWGIPIVWLEYRLVAASSIPAGIFPTKRRNNNLRKAVEEGKRAHWFEEVTFDSASRDGRPFSELLQGTASLPNPVSRRCSTQLKIRTVMRYLFSKGVASYSPYIGIRQDEAHRAIEILASCDPHEDPKFPLVSYKVREGEVLAFWQTSDFDLALQSYQGNCDLCFLKSKENRMRMMRENPGMATWWKNWESLRSQTSDTSGGTFRLGSTYEEVEKQAALLNLVLPPEDRESVPCSCAEKAFSLKETEDFC